MLSCLCDAKEWLNFQAKAVGTAGKFVNFSGYDEYVPMVDKPVDSVWNKQTSPEKHNISKGKYVDSLYFLIT